MTALQPSKVRTYAVFSSVMMVLCSPLLAMSYFATEDGAKSYAAGSVQAWAEPGRRLLEPLLTFASADRVYATYSLLVALLIPALPMAVWTVRRGRAPLAGTFERRASLAVAAAWSLFSAALLVVALAQQVDPANVSGNSVVNVGFVAGMIPGLLIACVCSTGLGVQPAAARLRASLRRGADPVGLPAVDRGKRRLRPQQHRRGSAGTRLDTRALICPGAGGRR